MRYWCSTPTCGAEPTHMFVAGGWSSCTLYSCNDELHLAYARSRAWFYAKQISRLYEDVR